MQRRRNMIALSVANEIEAPAQRVWKTLMDLRRFKDWNPFIRAARGKPEVGATLRMRVKSSLRVPLVFHPIVLVCDENRELRWKGWFLRPWIASGDHTFRLEETPEGHTRFVQREEFRGILPRLLSRLIEREARRGFELMNAALKTRVEGARPKAS